MEDNNVDEIVEKDNDMEKIVMTPYEYFQDLKGRIQTMDSKQLNDVYNNAIHLAEKYKRTGQKKGLRKLIFHLESMMKEKKVLEAGINRYVYKSDIEEYVDSVAKNQVVIVDLKNFERDIPDEVVEALDKVKDIFDEFYVVCTDYTGKLSKQVNKERREKDPILFGTFLNRNKQAINERFYYIGDWIDEYCDLTLDKMVAEMKEVKDKDIVNEIFDIPESKEELTNQLNSLHLEEDEEENPIKLTLVSNTLEEEKKKSFFDKVKTFLTKK